MTSASAVPATASNGTDAPVADAPGSQRVAPGSLDAAKSASRRSDGRGAATRALPLLVLPLGLMLVALASRPLWHTDLWGHLAYGRLIWETKSLPATEPLMPLSHGVEFVDTAWLSQVIGYLTIKRFGLPGLQFLAAACVTATAGILAWLGDRKTGNVVVTLIGLAAFIWLSWKQLFNGSDLSILIRPQMAGMVLFTVTLAVAAGRPSRWQWAIVPLTFAVWANLHGSFFMGLALLAAFAIGRGADVLRRTDKFGSVFRDWPFWRLVLLTELAAVAVLLNPYGLRIYAEVWLLVGNPNLQDLVEWEPLTLRMVQGQAAAGVAFVLLFLYRMTPRRVATGEVLALLLFGGLALWTSRMIVWFAPVAAYCLMVHAAAVWRTSQAKTATPAATNPPVRRRLWTFTAIGTAWVCFALTPFAQRLASGPRPEENRAVSSRTPTGAARHLAEHPAVGQVFNTYEFGDYLLWTSPGLPVFVAGHAHLVPTEVWNAYTTTIRGGSEWETKFDLYDVNVVVLDRASRQSFIDRLSEEPDWTKTYEDRNSAVFRRREPLR